MIKINNIIKYKLTYFKNHLDTYIKNIVCIVLDYAYYKHSDHLQDNLI